MFWFNNNKKNPEDVLSSINKKWEDIALKTESIDVKKLSKNIYKVYKELGYKKPELIFYDSPYLIWEYIINLAFENLSLENKKSLEKFLRKKLKKVESGFLKDLICQIVNIFKTPLEEELGTSLNTKINNFFLHEFQENNAKETQIQLNNFQFELGLNQIVAQLESELNNQLLINTLNKIRLEISNDNLKNALEKIAISLQTNKSIKFLNNLSNLLAKSLFSRYCIKPELWTLEAIKIEFSKTRGESFLSNKKWKLFQNIVENSGWILPFENICFISNRPVEININKQYHLHAEGKLALKFRDEKGFYGYEGVNLPEKYGKLKPEDWKSKWLLEEENTELRRVLIQGLGYDKIAAELHAEEIDSWREYTILRFNDIIDDIDKQPVCLLKMTCPSTEFIHALRIPPDFNSAREAIQWINWGVDPEDIAIAS